MMIGRMNGVTSKGDSWGRQGPEGKGTQCHLSLALEDPGRGTPDMKEYKKLGLHHAEFYHDSRIVE